MDINDLDFNNIGSWPPVAKGVVLLLVFGLVLAGGWYFDWQDQMNTLDGARARETQLKRTFELKQKRAANLEAYERQLAEMRTSFGAMLRQLPSKAEVAKLLVDISQTGLASGLEFELFKPQPEIKREFYAELPVKITVKGTYDQFGKFVSGIANLPRIVTLDSISIQPYKKGKKNANQDGTTELTMDITARTYWYLENDAKPAHRGKRRRRR